ncbi:MAG TPA: hypothetical protein VGY75_10605 [Candidatus Udaeobacter sp.]|jgi:hypothetical protein|nr:hypothetical protein [Candidatus Udaeobacter sp.]
MSDFAKRVSERIALEMEKRKNEAEQRRVDALAAQAVDESAANRETNDFVQRCERRMAAALLEAQLAKTAQKEEKIIAENLERSNQ